MCHMQEIRLMRMTRTMMERNLWLLLAHRQFLARHLVLFLPLTHRQYLAHRQCLAHHQALCQLLLPHRQYLPLTQMPVRPVPGDIVANRSGHIHCTEKLPDSNNPDRDVLYTGDSPDGDEENGDGNEENDDANLAPGFPGGPPSAPETDGATRGFPNLPLELLLRR